MLELKNVTRRFGDRVAISDVSFSVAPGRMTGFVGANGAGKTTTMRVILGVLAPDDGEVTFNGSPLDTATRASFGYMPEERGLYPKMRITEQLHYLGRLHGLGTRAAKDSTNELLEKLGLGERANDTLESLSLGNQQRAQIAAALVHDPAGLILDEPFSGLDPMAVDIVLEVLRSYAAKGAPVLFSSHQLDIVERLCDDLIVIADGKIRAAGDTKTLRNSHWHNSYELSLAPEQDAGWVRDEPDVTITELDGCLVRFDAANEAVAQKVLAKACALGQVAHFGQDRPSLVQIFKEVVQ